MSHICSCMHLATVYNQQDFTGGVLVTVAHHSYQELRELCNSNVSSQLAEKVSRQALVIACIDCHVHFSVFLRSLC